MKTNLFKEKRTEQPFLIMAHRGFWGGNILENSIESSILACQAGADIIEVDVCKTTDGVYYLFHDGNEPKLLGHPTNFKELHSKDVDSAAVLNSIGTDSGSRITKLKDFINWLPEGKLVNLDRSWEYFDDLRYFEIIEKSGKQDQLVFKSPVEEMWLDSFVETGSQLNYIPIIKSREEAETVMNQTGLNVIGLELIIDNLNSELLDEDWLSEIKDRGLLTVVNAEHLGKGFNLLGGLDDHTSILNGNDWSPITGLGMDVIQTDWPNFLNQFRKKNARED